MKRLMVMTGRAGKALLEINGDRSGAAVKYGGPGELWLFDGEGNSCRGERPPFIPVGAMAVKNGTVLLTGGFAGRKELMERARAEIMLRSPVPEKPRQDKERQAEKPSAPEGQSDGKRFQPQQTRQRPPQSQGHIHGGGQGVVINVMGLVHFRFQFGKIHGVPPDFSFEYTIFPARIQEKTDFGSWL